MHITEKQVDKLRASDVRQTYRDDSLTGFGIRIEPKAIGGRRSWFYNAKVGGHVVYKSLGDVSEVSVQEAREKARKLEVAAKDWKNAGCPADRNPFRKEQVESKESGAPLFRNLVDAYVAKHLQDKLRSEINHPDEAEKALRWMTNKYFADWMDRPVDTITTDDVIDVREAAAGKSYMQNRLVSCAKSLFRWCMEKNYDNKIFWPLVVNPAAGIKANRETKRKGRIEPEVGWKLLAALEEPGTSRDLHDFILLALSSGARKANLLGMRWAHIDKGVWYIPDEESKSGVGYKVYLLPTAQRILEERRALVPSSSPFVFPGRSTSQHLTDLQENFKRFLRRHNLPTDLRFHDMRHTAASNAASAGASQYALKELLGHSDARSSARYIELGDQDVRQAGIAGDAIWTKRIEEAKKAANVLELPASRKRSA